MTTTRKAKPAARAASPAKTEFDLAGIVDLARKLIADPTLPTELLLLSGIVLLLDAKDRQ